MADSKKNGIVVMCSVIGCIVTLITCGVLIGNMQGKQNATETVVKTLQVDVKHLTEGHSAMKSDQSYLKGVVSTKLSSLETNQQKLMEYLMQYDFGPKKEGK